jgi:hypothetical protein
LAAFTLYTEQLLLKHSTVLIDRLFYTMSTKNEYSEDSKKGWSPKRVREKEESPDESDPKKLKADEEQPMVQQDDGMDMNADTKEETEVLLDSKENPPSPAEKDVSKSKARWKGRCWRLKLFYFVVLWF